MAIFSRDALEGNHILITGATGGIGHAAAKVLAGMGAWVTVTGRDEGKLEALKKELLQITDEEHIFAQTADLTDADDRERLVSAAESALGFISGLVNSAGVSIGDTVENLTEEDLEQLMNINYKATFLLTQLVYRNMREKKRGAIVNLASLSGLRGTHGGTAYAASKFAVIGWTQSMALEAIEYGIRVNAVCPGNVDTAMARTSILRKADRLNIPFEQAMEEAKNSIPSGRLSTAEEVANTVAFLLTDAAGNIVGESIKISGGSVMR